MKVKRGSPLPPSPKELAEGDLMALVAKRFPDPEWAFLRQVRDATGYRQQRTADGIALNCFPSRGMELHGFEAKVSRSDWVRELKKPAKSAAIQRFCNRWWIVAPAGIVRVGEAELPPTWGLLEVPDGKTALVVTVEAPTLDPEPLTREFIASVLRSAARMQVTDHLLERARAEGYEEGGADSKRVRDRDLEHTQDALKRIEKQVADFETASGIKIGMYGWESGKIGRTVRLILDSGHASMISMLRRQLEQSRQIQQQISEALGELEEATPPPSPDRREP